MASGDRWERRWEIADIGVLVLFRQGGKLLRVKVALLQSKRLYPDEQEFEEDTPIEYERGFSRLLESDDEWATLGESRRFNFGDGSRYKALHIGSTQYNPIASFEEQQRVPVHYLLYHPLRVPSSTSIPRSDISPPIGGCEVGCRIIPARELRAVATQWTTGYSPSYSELRAGLGDTAGQDISVGWRLEDFIADRVIECDEGYIANGREDSSLNYVLYRRSAPISAAIAITLDAPAVV